MKFLGKFIYPALALVGLTGMVLSIISMVSTPLLIDDQSVWTWWTEATGDDRSSFPTAIRGAFGMATIGAVFGLVISLGALCLAGSKAKAAWTGEDVSLMMIILVIVVAAAALAISVAAIAESQNLSNLTWIAKKAMGA